jgi:hypothetical protein
MLMDNDPAESADAVGNPEGIGHSQREIAGLRGRRIRNLEVASGGVGSIHANKGQQPGERDNE